MEKRPEFHLNLSQDDDDDDDEAITKFLSNASNSLHVPDIDRYYHYRQDSGYHLPVPSTTHRGRTSNSMSLAPVAEVAPRKQFDDEIDNSSGDSDVFEVATTSKKGIPDDGPSTSKGGRPSTAEIFVALSEQRRSLAVAATDASRRSSKRNSNSSRKKSVAAPEAESIDPLRANLQMLTECFNLIRRNRRQLVFNVFLILLVALMLTSIIVFAVFAPAKTQFELVLTSWATFWPLNMRLRLYQLGRSLDSLTLTIGNADPQFTLRPPSYCSCCVDGAPECGDRDHDRCWCFDWHSEAKLYISSLRPANTTIDCLILEWRSLSHQRIEVTDCFKTTFSDGARWYGGVLTTDQQWPLNTNSVTVPFAPYSTNDVQSDPGGFYGAAQPLWISDKGFAVMVSLDHPFSVNRTETSVCLRSNGVTASPLRYMVCKTDDSRSYTTNISILNEKVSLSANYSVAAETKNVEESWEDDLLGTIFIGYDSSAVNADDLIEIEHTMASFKFSLTIIFEYFDLLNETMATNIIESLKAVKRVSGDSPEAAVEISNFLRFYHLEGNEGQILQNRCVRQSGKNTIGVSKWRDNIYACLDFTRTAVSDWFIQLCSKHVINTVINYVALAGGDASSLPILPNLNISNSQTNFYSTFYALTAASVPKSFLVDVAYNTKDLSKLYVNLATSPNDVRSLIPLMLSASLQGYSKVALNLINYTIPGSWWRLPAGNTDPLYTWLELAMFAPIFRVPMPVLNWTGFNNLVTRFKPFREQVILKHYRQASKANRLRGQPIFKPIWWTNYNDYRQGKYSLDEAQVWANDRQFMIGDDLLVAAFLQLDGVAQMVYLPPGHWWDPVLQQGSFQGGQFVYIATVENVACFERCPPNASTTADCSRRNVN